MGLAMLTGRGRRGLRETIPGHVPVPERNVVLAAVRDLEDYQRRRLAGCGRLATERLNVAGAAITAYDPVFDADGSTITAARAVAHEIARGIRPQPASATG